MLNFFKTISILFLLLYFVSCQTVKPNSVVFEDCIKLSNSVFCIDERLDNKRVDLLISRINSNGSLTVQLKEELVAYLNKDRKEIVRKKEFEFSDKYLQYFKGYTMIHPMDRNDIFKRFIELEKENEILRRNCGNEE